MVSDKPFSLKEFLREVERDLIERTLKKTKGNTAQAAKDLGIKRTTLYHKRKKMGLPIQEITNRKSRIVIHEPSE